MLFGNEGAAGSGPTCGIGGRDPAQGRGDRLEERLFRPRHQPTQYLLHLAPHLLDRIQVRTVRGKKTEFLVFAADSSININRFPGIFF